jgi:23S rRNA (guanosine2251-2'-O)-methyltransferase
LTPGEAEECLIWRNSIVEKLNQQVFGIRPVLEAIEAGKEIDKILLKRGLEGDLFKELFQVIRQREIPYSFVPEEKLNRITRKNHQGVIADISAIEYQDIEKIIPLLYERGEVPFLLILDGITDVRNFGAVCRTAECAGIHAVIIPIKGSATANADALKTSAGALNHIPVCRVSNLSSTIKYLKNCGVQIIAATEKAVENYTEPDYKKPVAIVMGSEDIGISDELLKQSDLLVAIPIVGKVKSLNVSVAAAIMIYEGLRQREIKAV